MFENSCFGNFFQRMYNIVLSGGIIDNIIIRQMESMNKNIIEFNFNCKGVIFSKKKIWYSK